MEYIKHVGRYVSSSRNAAHEARGSADNSPKSCVMTKSCVIEENYGYNFRDHKVNSSMSA